MLFGGALIALGFLLGITSSRGDATGLALARWTLELPDRSVPLTLPGHFDDVFPRDSDLVLRARVELPPELRGRELSLSIPYYGGVSSLDVDGEPAPDTVEDLVRGYRARGPHSFRIPATATGQDAITLRLHVQHRWTQSAWLATVPRLHPSDQRDERVLRVRTVNDVMAALGWTGLAQIALTYLAVYALGRRQRAFVLFALQLFAASYFHLFVLGFTQAVLGTYDVTGLATMITIALVASVYVTAAQFGLPKPSRAWSVMAAVSIAAAWSSSGPYESTRGVMPTIVVLSIVVAYQVITLGRLTWSYPRPLGAETMFVAWILLAIPSVADAVILLGLGEPLGGVRPDSIGLLAFALVSSLLLGREYLSSMNRSDELNETLAKRVADLEAGKVQIEGLNTELRRQISDRSRQLFDALGLLASPNGEPLPTLAAGAIVQDRYRVVRPVGQGGMGAVYEVLRIADGERLALKVTHEVDRAALARLAREAHVASRIAHRNVVGIVDVDIGSSGMLYIVFEYVEGATLRDLRQHFAEAPWASSVLAQTACGLEALHEAGIVHRDLKPANVLVADAASSRPRVKLADFGISRVVSAPPAAPSQAARAASERPTTRPLRAVSTDDSAPTLRIASTSLASFAPAALTTRPAATSSRFGGASATLTVAGQLVGTPMYMAPELAREPGLISPSADMFSFGVMAYQLLVGSMPFAESPAFAALCGHTIATPAPVGALRRDIDPVLAELVDRCLSLEPAARPTASEVTRALSGVLEDAA